MRYGMAGFMRMTWATAMLIICHSSDCKVTLVANHVSATVATSLALIVTLYAFMFYILYEYFCIFVSLYFCLSCFGQQECPLNYCSWPACKSMLNETVLSVCSVHCSFRRRKIGLTSFFQCRRHRLE